MRTERLTSPDRFVSLRSWRSYRAQLSLSQRTLPLYPPLPNVADHENHSLLLIEFELAVIALGGLELTDHDESFRRSLTNE